MSSEVFLRLRCGCGTVDPSYIYSNITGSLSTNECVIVNVNFPAVGTVRLGFKWSLFIVVLTQPAE